MLTNANEKLKAKTPLPFFGNKLQLKVLSKITITLSRYVKLIFWEHYV
jgi:hypothetical protein